MQENNAYCSGTLVQHHHLTYIEGRLPFQVLLPCMECASDIKNETCLGLDWAVRLRSEMGWQVTALSRAEHVEGVVTQGCLHREKAHSS